MKNSIYISNKQIQVVGYESKRGEGIEIQKYISADLPERVVFNGVITDHAVFNAVLSQLVSQNPDMFKNVSLIIDTNAITVKKVQVPKLPKKQYDEIVSREIEGITGAYEHLIYDYNVLTGEEETNLLIYAIDRPIIESYINIMKEVGVELSAIRLGLDIMIAMANNVPELSQGANVLCILDDVSLLSTIFVNGTYTFSTRARIMAESDTEFIERMYQNLTSLVQFHKDVSNVYYLGVPDRLMDRMPEMKPAKLDEVDIKTFDLHKLYSGREKLDPNCHFSVIGAFEEKNSINLINAYKKSFGSAKTKRTVKPLPIAICALGIVALLALGVVWLNILSDKSAIKEAKLYLEDPKVMTDMAEVNSVNSSISSISSVLGQYQLAELTAKIYPSINEEVFSVLFGPAASSVSIKELDFDAGTRILELTYSCASEFNSSTYVNQIKDYEGFEDVLYNGYSAQENGYVFRISIILKAMGVE